MISIAILLAVFVLIAVRRLGRYRLPIWLIMLLGAAAALLTAQISPAGALRAINVDVMLFLFGVFVIGQAMEESGYLSQLSNRLFSRARTFDALVLATLFGAGAAAALLMNDTLAIIGTPVMLLISAANRKSVREPKVLLLALAFAVTIGSVASPIGNPQNLLIALNGQISNPFLTFLKFLLVPTVANLFLAYLVLRLFFRKHFAPPLPSLSYPPAKVKDPALARLAGASLGILVTLIVVKIVLVFLAPRLDFRLTYVALAAAAPVLLFSRRRLALATRIDWSTLVFFAAMFVLMAAVWQSGFFQSLVGGAGRNLTSTGSILGVSIGLSQFISNVPLVSLYLPMLMHSGATEAGLMALAAGSTIAGNLTILGAASNVIIIQSAEKKGNETLTFGEFVRVGVPLTAVNVLVYWLYFLLVS
jgi:Na+/H+ antiporter NhaD/arsenite permease-like protein